jgi:cysteine desulfurase
MAVNNETGVIQPIQDIAYKCKTNGIIFHTDAVQAFGHLQLDVDLLGIDMMSMSAHKIHGPKGVGALYISEDIRKQMNPWIAGGQQERGMRGSTENVAGIVGFAKAAELAYQNIAENNAYIKGLCESLVAKLSEFSGVHTNVNMRDTDYRHISLRMDGIKGEEMVSLLDNADIYVSSGAACNSNSNEPSHVLKALELSDEEANSSIRISLSELNTEEELQLFVNYFGLFIKLLRSK